MQKTQINPPHISGNGIYVVLI